MEIKDLCDELNAKCLKLEDELAEYKFKVCPKFLCGQKLYCADIVGKAVVELTPNEIAINKFGVNYREYISETELKQFNEIFCFEDLDSANNALNDFLQKQNTSEN